MIIKSFPVNAHHIFAMKRFSIFALLFSFCYVIAQAQEIKVESITPLPNDLEARTNPRQDSNGTDCALLKVIVPALKDLSFEGWVIGDIAYSPGEFKVYVPAGTKKIKFRHEKYRPGEIVFDFPIESKCVYEVVLQVPDEKGKGWVTFHLQSDAKVSIDGKTYKSPSNGLLKVQLPYGKYAYQIESEGFSSKKGEVKISREPEYIEGFLTGTCEVIIQAYKGTRLTISGMDKGTLQGTSKIFLSEGKYKFTGIYNGVKRTKTVKIEKGQSTLTVNLKAVD